MIYSTTSDLPAATEGDLPAPLSSLVGRRRELETLSDALGRARMVTVVGPGGCGKSRLAIELAARLAPAYAGGAWWVELDPLTGRGLVAGRVAATFDVRQVPDEEPLVSLLGHLRRRVVLLVLDNCEHVVNECAELAERLLRSCPGLRILATSREFVGVTGEQLFRLGGLGPGAAGANDAVTLFVERARAAAPGFVPDDQEQGVIAAICERLDGLPLAIELAAARTGVLSLPEIASRLEDSRLLRHPNRSAPSRHLTLGATLEWSYLLLTPEEQALFERLAVFSGSFSLLAAEAVGACGQIDVAEVLPLLSSLVDRSLVQVADRGAEKRYRLLQTVRHYAEGKLSNAGDSEGVRKSHTAFFLELAIQGHAGLEGFDQVRWLERLDLEHDNFQAVLRRQLPAQPEVGGRLAALLWPFWYRRGYYHEARWWLEQAVSVSRAMSAQVAAEVLTGAGTLAFLQCDYKVATGLLQLALMLNRQGHNRVGVAKVLERLGAIAREQARYGDARRLHAASREVWEEIGDQAGVAASEDYLCFVAWLEGDLAAAEEHGARAVAYFEGTGRRQETAAALINRGTSALYRRDHALAVKRLERALAISREIGYLEGVAWSTHELGSALWRTDPEAALPLLCESITIHAQLGDRWRIASLLETVAGLVLVRRDPAMAVRLMAASQQLRDTLGAPVPAIESAPRDEAMAALRATLGAGAFRAEWEAGAALGVTPAVEAAASVCQAVEVRTPLPEPAAAPADAAAGYPTGLPPDLTERELAVLRLVSEGLTNREIAKRLYISTGTAGVHVSNILRKLGVTSRVQAATLASRLASGK